MKGTFTRRTFAAGAGGAFTSIAIVRAPARAAQFEFKCGHNTPVDHPESVRSVEMWNAVKKQSGGRLDVKVFAASQLGGDVAMLTQLRAGSIQFNTLAGSTLAGIVPIAAIEGIGFAFKSTRDAWGTFDGPLGAYVRKEIDAKGLMAFEKIWDVGFRQVTSSKKPVHTPADLEGFKIRTPPGKIWLDLFQTLGASPTSIDIREAYIALQTKVVDGQENPPAIIETQRFFEVQKYLSQTNHMFTGKWFLANAEAWKSLPPDLKEIVQRNINKYALLQRADTQRLNDTLSEKLGRQGMVLNAVDPKPFRARLGAYYARWKAEFGPQAWDLLESVTGKLA